MSTGMQKYIIKQKIGVGSFGQVFLVHDTKRNQTLAMKKMKEHFSCYDEVKNLMQVKILSKLSHPNIIKLREYSYEKQSQQGNLFFEYCQSDICKKFCYNTKQRPAESEIKKHIFEIASALSYAHNKNYIHRDIKPENILIQKNQFEGKEFDVAKLCDFGISKRSDELPLTDYVGTRWYRAPELLIKMKNYSKNVDIFSLGCMMAEFYNLQILFNGKSSHDQLVMIIKKLGTPTKESWPEFSNWCKLKGITYGKYEKSEDPIIFKAKEGDLAEDLIQKMLVMNPKNRISAEEVLKHKYFDDVRGELLKRQYAAKPVKQIGSEQVHVNQAKSQKESAQNMSLKGLQKIEVKTYHSTNADVKTHHSTDREEKEEKESKGSDAKKQNQKIQKNKQGESSEEVKEANKQKNGGNRPPMINKPAIQRNKVKSPEFYSPYESSGMRENNRKSKQKFDYYQTYIAGRSNHNRTQSNYQMNNSTQKQCNSSQYQPENK